MPPIDPVLKRMLEAFNNREDDSLTEGLFDEGVVVHFFPLGRSDEMLKFSGVDEVREWARHGPRADYTISVTKWAESDQRDDLPGSDRALTAHYRIEMPEFDFVNEGDWTLHIIGDRIAALRAEPHDLE